jgi:antitoxin component YwqK of YwqJK toxin-antitoxin module
MRTVLFFLFWTGVLLAQGNPCGFKKGLQTGTCKQFYDNGQVLEIVEWKEGKKEGDAVFYHSNGQVSAKGKFKKDFKVGDWTYYSNNGKITAVEKYENGINNVYLNNFTANFYNEKGILIETSQFKKNKLDGESKWYDDSGKYIGSYIYKNSADGYTKVEKDGKLYAEGKTLDNGKRDGEWTTYFANGEKEIGSFSNGKFHGKWKLYYPNGKLKIESNYQDNLREGKRFIYTPEGKVEKTELYEKGKLISTN